jgi:hypothetical protein
MKTKALFITVLLIGISFSCNKDDTEETTSPAIPPATGIIKQPLSPTDPAILPAIETVIKKLEGSFSPLLTGVVANWKVESSMKYESFLGYTCWSDWKTTYWDMVPREGVKGKSVKYSPCHWTFTSETRTPDFSANSASVWGQYKNGEEQQDGEMYTISSGGSPIHFKRYYTLADLPDAYIKMEKRWEIIPIPGEGEYAHCEGCSSLEKTTSTTTGLSVEKTKEWGYTLGIERNAGVNLEFFEAGAKVTASFNQQFSTSIQNYEETTTSITLTGTLPAGKNIIRLQAFREISTFSLVNENGDDYYPGVYSPIIEITTQTLNYVWYY